MSYLRRRRYLVTELHVWMLCVRLADDGAEGKFCKGQLITAMWEDLETRSKKLGSVAASLRNEQIQQTSHHFQVRRQTGSFVSVRPRPAI